ncbi:hypothetical protein [Ktedonobacter sp. SOSP1-52]|uniref:hypothetical protein n=1 Tax=Ktedonobacter sp. SOSP1-52 TaxID=2778366 RepID=UPI00191598C9|nr:hypothetical protein [Ktedonobacter sp. SOSP1-52]
MPTIAQWCAGCKLPIHGSPPGEECPRCQYPVELEKEKNFLRRSIQDLVRVAAYQHRNITVGQLIVQHQARLNTLQQIRLEIPAPMPLTPPTPAMNTQAPSVVSEKQVPTLPISAPVDHIHNGMPSVEPTRVVQPGPAQSPISPVIPVRANTSRSEEALAPSPEPQAVTRSPRQMFSLRTFFEDQTINIVASLGAFLLLTGSLNFIATTPDLLKSFIVMLLVHIVFGATGIVTRRFDSFRIVSIIYTAIFALLIPLVSFSAYRLASGSLVTFSPAALVAMVTAYAAIAYGSLAIYQRFSLFSYLSLAALSIADVATLSAFHLALPWLFCGPMLLALGAMLCLPPDKNSASIFDGRLAVLHDPLRVCMYLWVGICALGALLTIAIALSSEYIILPGISNLEEKIALCGQIALLLGWCAGMAWRTRKTYWVTGTCYLFIVLALTIAFACSLRPAGYAVVLISVAAYYHILLRFAPSLMRQFRTQGLEKQLEDISLTLIALAPLVGEASMPLHVFLKTFTHNDWLPLHTPTAMIDSIATLVVCILGLLLTLSSVQLHTKLQRQLAPAQARWCWLLLLCGFLLYWLCGETLLLSSLHPTWLFLGVTLLLTALGFQTRARYSQAWSNPIELVALTGMGLTLFFAISQTAAIQLSLLLGFEVISYGLAIAQRRPGLLVLSMVLGVLAIGPLFDYIPFFFSLCLVLPVLAAGISRQFAQCWPRRVETRYQRITWEWPTLFQGLLYGLLYASMESIQALSGATTGVLAENLQPIAIPILLELALLAAAWYIGAILARRPFWLIVSAFFAGVAICLPSNNFLFLAWLAPMSILVALAARMRFGRVWSAPLAISAFLATLMVGISGSVHHEATLTTWVLLLCASLYYVAGIISQEPAVTGLTPATLVLLIACSFANFSLLTWIAPISILLMLGAHLWLGRTYSVALGITALIATITLGVLGTSSGNQTMLHATFWLLLLCATLFYGAGLLSKGLEETWIAVLFAAWGLFLPTNTFNMIVWIAPLGILLALGIHLLMGRARALPMFVIVVLATFDVGLMGMTSGNSTTLLATFWLLLLSAALYYIAGLLSKEHEVTWLAGICTIWAFCLPINTFAILTSLAPTSILLALGIRLWRGPRQALALTVCANVATIALGVQGTIYGEMASASWVLLLCAQLFYVGGLVSEDPFFTWLAPAYTTWSVYYAGALGDLYRPVLIALTFALLGSVSKYIAFFRGGERDEKRDWWHNYSLPLYATALASALLTGIYGSLSNVNFPFYAAVPDILIVYALVAYGVLLNERKAPTRWQALVFAFAAWGLLRATRVLTCDPVSQACSVQQVQQQSTYLLTLTLGLGGVGLLVGRLVKLFARGGKKQERETQFLALPWNASWYLASLLGLLLMFGWQMQITQHHYAGLPSGMLVTLLALSLVVMLVERMPELVLLSSALALWIISTLPFTNWQAALAYSALNILIFTSQWLWHRLRPRTHWLPTSGLATIVSLMGQVLVVGSVIMQGGLSSSIPVLAHTGAFTLLVLSMLIASYGYTQRRTNWQRWAYYSACLLGSLALSWELLALQQTQFDVLTLPPATALILIAAFLQRDEGLLQQRAGAQLCALAGTALLLLPTLWLSFQGSELAPTLLLGGEALVLLLVGIGTHIRVFVLSGAGLVVIAAMHALFLPSLGLPSSLALAIMGLSLLILATALSLTRHRLRSAWTQWQ